MSPAIPTKTKDYAAITSLDDFKRMIDMLGADLTKPICFDIETGYSGPDKPKGSLDPFFGFIVGFSLTNDASWARYTPLRHDFGLNLDPDDVLPLLKPLLEQGLIVCHNHFFEKRWLRKVGIEINAHSDTMLEAYLLSEWKSVSLKKLVLEIFNHRMTELSDLFPQLKGKKLECMRFNTLEISPEVVSYACEDSAWCLPLHLKNHPRVKDMFLYKVEHENMEIVCDMSDWGVLLDWEDMRQRAAKAEVFMTKMNKEIMADLSALTGTAVNFNLHSPNALKKVLYEQMGLKTSRKTKTGAASTDAVAMAGLAKKVPVVKKILEFREVEALYKRYLDKWPKQFSSAPDSRAHPNYKQTVVGTGRFAVDDPSLQQCPKKYSYELSDGTEFKGNFRNSIIAAEGYYLLDFDYCLEGSTLIETLRGPVPISEIQPGDFVYSWSEGSISWSQVTRAALVGCLPAMRVHLDNGESFVGSTDHNMVMYDGSLKPLSALVSSDRLAAQRFSWAGQHYRTTYSRSSHDYAYVHRLVAAAFFGPCPEGYEVHHRDEDKTNNLPDNFEYLEQATHRRLQCGFRDKPNEDKRTYNLCVALRSRRSYAKENNPRWKPPDQRGVEVICALCGIAFRANPSSKSKFCGHPCYLNSRRQQCGVCGVFYNARRSVKITGFCSDVCRDRDLAGQLNHRVIRVELLADDAEMWAITVEPDHNYALSCGVISGNSQVELRVMAGLSQEPALMDAFNNDRDVHTITAAMMLGVSVAQVTEDMRAIGKALHVDEPVAIPDGWIRMGDISVGDEVLVPDGGRAKVAAVYPQGERALVCVTFSDETSVICDWNHLWAVQARHDYKFSRGFKRMTTRQIFEAGLARQNGKGRPVWNWYIPMTKPVDFDSFNLAIHPYVMGALIGDGSLSGPGVVFCTNAEDTDEVERMRELLPSDYRMVPQKGASWNFHLLSGQIGSNPGSLGKELVRVGLRGRRAAFEGKFGCKAENKFIPRDYMYTSVSNRLELLRGLMDTDGTCGKQGSVQYCTVSKQLAEDVRELVQSLGGTAKIRTKIPTYKYKDELREGQLAFIIFIKLPQEICPFWMARKADHWTACSGVGRRLDRKIVAIEPAGWGDTQCITVDHPDHLFLTRHHIVSSNTMNFALLYGMGPGSLADRLAISRERARELYDAYFASFASITAWMDTMKREGRARGYSMSKFGRKYTIWELQSSNMAIYSKGERVCVNAPVQGGAADIMKIAMFRVKKVLQKQGWYGDKVRIILNNHDALTFEVHNSITPQEAEAVIRPAVEFPVEGFPKIVAEFSTGLRWGSMKEMDKDTPESDLEEELDRLKEEVDVESVIQTAPQQAREERPNLDSVEHVQRMTEAIENGATDSIPNTGISLIVELTDMPTQSQYARFLDLCSIKHGPNSITIKTPQGELEPNWGVSLTVDDQPQISMIFDSARVFEAVDSVDTDALVADIQL